MFSRHVIVTKFVGRKEADRVGSWRLRCFYLRQINSHRCALCVTRKHQLSRSSQRSLSVFVPAVSLWQLVRPSLHSVSLSELPFHGGFYPVSTPITAIRHRWSSFCTWPTYLPLSPESFSRCRLRWTTPPSPQSSIWKSAILKAMNINNAIEPNGTLKMCWLLLLKMGNYYCVTNQCCLHLGISNMAAHPGNWQNHDEGANADKAGEPSFFTRILLCCVGC